MGAPRLPLAIAAAVEAALDIAETGHVSAVPFADPIDRERVRQAVLRRARARGIRITTLGRHARGLLGVRLDDGTPW